MSVEGEAEKGISLEGTMEEKLLRRVGELEETVRWILRWIKATGGEFEGEVPEIVRSLLGDKGKEEIRISSVTGSCGVNKNLAKRSVKGKRKVGCGENSTKSRETIEEDSSFRDVNTTDGVNEQLADEPVNHVKLENEAVGEIPASPGSFLEDFVGGEDSFQECDSDLEPEVVTDKQLVSNEVEKPPDIVKGPLVQQSNKTLNPHVTLIKLTSEHLQKFELNPESIKKVAKIVNSKWKCTVCAISFPGRYALHWHKFKENHYTVTRPGYHANRKCPVCFKCFPTIAALNCHKRKNGHFREAVKCGVCEALFPSRRAMFQHQRAEHKGYAGKVLPGEYKCSVCQATFDDYGAFGKHKSRENHYDHSKFTGRIFKNALRTCKTCGETFRTTRALAVHRRAVHKKAIVPKPPKCKAPSKPEEPTCSVCNATFSDRVTLYQHKSRENHYDPSKFPGRTLKQAVSRPCKTCGETFRTVRALAVHRRTVHRKDSQEQLRCLDCNAIFSTRSSLSAHQKEENHFTNPLPVTQPRPCSSSNVHPVVKTPEVEAGKSEKTASISYSCLVCGKEFPSRNKLLYHKKREDHYKDRHEKKKSCEYCGKVTGGGYRYRNHVVQHTKEKEHLCNICGKRLSRHDSLKKHIDICHSEKELPKPFQCKYCGKVFRTKLSVKSHEHNKHEGGDQEKEPCPHCGFEFKLLHIHIREVHEKIRPHECHLCEKKFKKYSHLKRHVASHSNPNGRKKGYHIDRPYKPSKRGRNKIEDKTEEARETENTGEVLTQQVSDASGASENSADFNLEIDAAQF